MESHEETHIGRVVICKTEIREVACASTFRESEGEQGEP